MKLESKVAVVVGGGSGIGRATSKLLAEEGAIVIVGDIEIEKANRVVDEIKAKGGRGAAFQLDMTSETEANGLVRFAIDSFGHIDILANVAGGSVGPHIREKFSPFAESTKAEWDRIIDVNLNGARNCTRAVVNHMMQRGRGKIVSFSSVAGITGMRNTVDYSAAKAAVIGFTKALAQELGPYGIQVNCIAPTGVATERMHMFSESAIKNGQPGLDLSKLAKPEELAQTVLFLVSDDVTRINGECIVVAGTTGR
jgi:3-oxoacyl-[acyl-carrier protein] reductase